MEISSISRELEIENLKEISESPNDTLSPHHFIVTQKQFKEFIKNDGFKDSEIFVRMKKNVQ